MVKLQNTLHCRTEYPTRCCFVVLNILANVVGCNMPRSNIVYYSLSISSVLNAVTVLWLFLGSTCTWEAF